MFLHVGTDAFLEIQWQLRHLVCSVVRLGALQQLGCQVAVFPVQVVVLSEFIDGDLRLHEVVVEEDDFPA